MNTTLSNMNPAGVNSEEEDTIIEDEVIERAFEVSMEGYELDLSMALEDIMFEMFAYGFESAMELVPDDNETEEEVE